MKANTLLAIDTFIQSIKTYDNKAMTLAALEELDDILVYYADDEDEIDEVLRVAFYEYLTDYGYNKTEDIISGIMSVTEVVEPKETQTAAKEYVEFSTVIFSVAVAIYLIGKASYELTKSFADKSILLGRQFRKFYSFNNCPIKNPSPKLLLTYILSV